MATTPLPGSGSFPGNSHAQKAGDPKAVDRPKVTKVITGDAVEKKKSIWKKISNSFTGDDAKSVGQFILLDVLVPAFKNMLSDAVTQGVERTLFGGDARGRLRSSSSSYYPYNRISSPLGGGIGTPPWEPQQPTLSRRARTVHDFREIVLPSRADATLVLDTLSEMAQRYDVATVADFYDAVGATSEYTDRQYGWTDLSTGRVERVRDGYIILLPNPQPLR